MLRSSGRFLLPLLAGFVFAAGVAGTASVAAEESGLAFHDVWARAASRGHMSAVYMHVVNGSGADVVIVAARSEVADRVELHETTLETTVADGKISQVMSMREIPSLTVPAGGTVELKPGGLHIMLIDLTRDIETGDRFALELELADGRRVALEVPVKVGAGDDDHDHHDHHDH